ncbi:MAG: PTS IIA-like nitrogen regulatory protein PtsN [Cellvibrionaceae bacterium]
MKIASLLTPELTLWGLEGSSKKKTLELIAEFIASKTPGIDPDDLFRSLIQREKLGSTGLGHGIAIPHSRFKQCSDTIGALIKLTEPVDFNSIDNQPVDLLFVMIVPEQSNDSHLEALSALAEKFMEDSYRKALRTTENAKQLFEVATAEAVLK